MDTIPRYAPNCAIVSTGGRFMVAPVQSYVVHPPNTHPQSPICNHMVALELKTAYGSSWWGGFDRAYINSELRMVVVGIPERCEIRQKWEKVPDGLA